MISFKDIELKDKELITSYTQQSPRRNCDLSFSNLCSWRFLYDTQFAVQDGHWPVRNSKLNETTSINSVGPIPIMNMFLSLPTVYRNVSIWKPNGAK